MKNPTRLIPLAALFLGILAVSAAVACSGGGSKPAATGAGPLNAEATGSAAVPSTPTLTATATATPTSTPTPTPTPTPFAGDVARLVYPRFGVSAPIENLGITPDNAMDTPKKENTNVGWYDIYDRPGWMGNAIFSAHIYYRGIPAPFVKLQQAATGDEVQVVMADGTTYKYAVFSKASYHRDRMDTGAVIWPKERPANEEWITLISCGGQLDSTGQEYIDRIVVVAKRVA